MLAPSSSSPLPLGGNAVAGRRWLALSAAVLLWAMSAVFAARRISGQFHEALSGLEFLVLTIAMVGALCGVRLVGRVTGGVASPAAERVILIAPTLAAVLLAVAVSLPGSSPAGLVLLWTALAVEEAWWWRREVALPRRGRPGRVQTESPERAASPPGAIAPSEPLPAGAALEEVEESPPFPPDALQQISRFRDAEGGEAIHGLLRAELAPRQRVAYLHVAFCPPFETTPELAFEQMEGPEASLTPGQVEPFGARIDVRLSRSAAQKEDVVVEFYARARR